MEPLKGVSRPGSVNKQRLYTKTMAVNYSSSKISYGINCVQAIVRFASFLVTYFAMAVSYASKRLITLAPVVNILNLFFFITDEVAKCPRLFVPGKPFQPCLMFVGKVMSLP
jgi:hypothetical protein